MSTDETDRLKPLRQGGVCVLVSVEGRASTAKKKARPALVAGRVPSDLSLGWSLITITGDTEDVNS